MENNRSLGIKGEALAERFLKKKKYKILDKNFRTPLGEIDLIAKLGDTFIFVEVKDRTTKEFGLPREAVTVRKQNTIRTVAQIWLKKGGLLEEKIRFDVVEILDEQINHLENAF